MSLLPLLVGGLQVQLIITNFPEKHLELAKNHTWSLKLSASLQKLSGLLLGLYLTPPKNFDEVYLQTFK